MTFKEFLGKYGHAIIALVAIAGGFSVSQITDLLQGWEHLGLLHGVGAGLTVLLSYVIFQVQKLPEIVKRVGEHSEELTELAKGHARMVALNEQAAEDRRGMIAQAASDRNRMVELFEKLEKIMEKDHDNRVDIDKQIERRLGHLEGFRNGHHR